MFNHGYVEPQAFQNPESLTNSFCFLRKKIYEMHRRGMESAEAQGQVNAGGVSDSTFRMKGPGTSGGTGFGFLFPSE